MFHRFHRGGLLFVSHRFHRGGLLFVSHRFHRGGLLFGSIGNMPIKEQLRPVLRDFPAIRLAVLFGSTARGNDTPRSDVDLGVFLEEDVPGQLWPIGVAAAGALRRTIDLVDLRRSPPLLRFEIARDGRPLIEREEGEWVRFKVRAMLDWWDWAPVARKFHKLPAQRLRQEIRRGQA